MDAPCARAWDCSCVYVCFKPVLPVHKVGIVLQAFIPTTASPILNFNQLQSAITAMVWIPVKLIPGAHTWTVQAGAGLSSVLACRQGRVTCGCGREERRHVPARRKWQLLCLPSTGCAVWAVMKPGERCEQWRRRRDSDSMMSNLKPNKQTRLFHWRDLKQH